MASPTSHGRTPSTGAELPGPSAPGPSSGSSSRPSSRPLGILSMPPKWLHSYDNFITKNLSQVSQIESALRSLTYIIPGRFRDAEIASEAIHSGVQLLSLYHDLLLLRTPLPAGLSASSIFSASPTKPPPEAMHQPSQHSRYTRYWIQKSPFYRRVAIVLQIVRYTELLCEMAAKRRGERLRWRVVMLIEAIKAVCRLLLLRVTRGRTLVSPALPVRQPLPEAEDEDNEEFAEYEDDEEAGIILAEGAQAVDEEQDMQVMVAAPVDATADETTAMLATPRKQLQNTLSPEPPLSPPPSPLSAKATAAASTDPLPQPATPPSPPSTSQQQSPRPGSPDFNSNGWTMPRTGMSLPPLPQPGDISSYLLARVLTADDIKPATKLLNQLRGSAHAAEILHILAPLVFAIAMARNRNRRTSWTPWIAGLAVELAARQMRDHNSLRTTTLEREEWSRRGWAMGWWTMRGAFYEQAMKGLVSGVSARMPSFMGGILEDYEYLWENYYFSTSP